MYLNKIYQNFIFEILKTFLVILFGLSVIALTVRAVNFLDLIVENGYPLKTYFQYSFLNFLGLAPKFIPFSFLLALTIFIIKHLQNNELLILWTAGVKKIQIVKIFFLTSILVLTLYIFFTAIVSPISLNKSRYLLNQEEYNSILPVLKTQEFNDTFKGLIFFVDKKFNNEVQNIFLQDRGNHFKNLSSNPKKNSITNIVAQKGIIEKKKIVLLKGQIISSSKETEDSEIIKFDQLNIDLSNINTNITKNPKLQETSTSKLINCLIKKELLNPNCAARDEIIATLNRRLILPFYIPAISLICSLLLVSSRNIFFNRNLVFGYSFLLLVSIELSVRYSGINTYVLYGFLLSPLIIIGSIYLVLSLKFLKEIK